MASWRLCLITCLITLLHVEAGAILHRRALVRHAAAAAATTSGATAAHAVAYRTEPYSRPNTPGRTKPKCKDIESCQAEGERREAEADAKAGPLRNVGPIGANGLGRVRYRAMKETSDGPPLRQGDAADIRFDVLSTSGNLMYGVPSREPGEQATAILDSYRMVLGSRDVPEGVELALEGAHKGDFRRIEVPPVSGACARGHPRPCPSCGVCVASTDVTRVDSVLTLCVWRRTWGLKHLDGSPNRAVTRAGSASRTSGRV